MAIKLKLTKESTQRELSEKEWAFPIWRWRLSHYLIP